MLHESIIPQRRFGSNLPHLLFLALACALLFAGCVSTGKGKTLYDQKRYAEAIPALEDALSKNPKNAEGWYLLGRSYESLKKGGKAAYAFSKAIENGLVGPNMVDAYAGWTAGELSMRNYKKSLQLAEELLKIHPNHCQGLFFKAQDEFFLNQCDQALSTFTTFSEICKSDYRYKSIYLWIARTQFARGDFRSALDNAVRQLKKDPKNLTAGIIIALSKIKLGDAHDVRKILSYILEKSKTPWIRSLAFCGFAYLSLQENNPQDAKAYLEKARLSSPDNMAKRIFMPDIESAIQAAEKGRKEPARPLMTPVAAAPAMAKAGPALRLTSFVVAPAKIEPGGSFTAKATFVASDPAAKEGKLTVTVAYSILKDGKVLVAAPPESVTAGNGVNATLEKPMTASKTPGEYALAVKLDYKGVTKQAKATFSIE